MVKIQSLCPAFCSLNLRTRKAVPLIIIDLRSVTRVEQASFDLVPQPHIFTCEHAPRDVELHCKDLFATGFHGAEQGSVVQCDLTKLFRATMKVV